MTDKKTPPPKRKAITATEAGMRPVGVNKFLAKPVHVVPKSPSRRPEKP